MNSLSLYFWVLSVLLYRIKEKTFLVFVWNSCHPNWNETQQVLISGWKSSWCFHKVFVRIRVSIKRKFQCRKLLSDCSIAHKESIVFKGLLAIIYLFKVLWINMFSLCFTVSRHIEFIHFKSRFWQATTINMGIRVIRHKTDGSMRMNFVFILQDLKLLLK